MVISNIMSNENYFHNFVDGGRISELRGFSLTDCSIFDMAMDN